ncbi:MAG: TonB-dependent receptor, partial [Flavobacteriaceae bacterium]
MVLLFPIASLWGQEKQKEDLGVQEVLVIKSYTPSLSDAFKINSLPKLPDSLVSKQHKLIYSLK